MNQHERFEIDVANSDVSRAYASRIIRRSISDISPTTIPTVVQEAVLAQTFRHAFGTRILFDFVLLTACDAVSGNVIGAIHSHTPRFVLGKPLLSHVRLLEHLAVARPHRARGIGRKLVEEAQRRHMEEGATLWVGFIGNAEHGSASFYSATGFEIMPAGHAPEGFPALRS